MNIPVSFMATTIKTRRVSAIFFKLVIVSAKVGDASGQLSPEDSRRRNCVQK